MAGSRVADVLRLQAGAPSAQRPRDRSDLMALSKLEETGDHFEFESPFQRFAGVEGAHPVLAKKHLPEQTVWQEGEGTCEQNSAQENASHCP